MPSHPAAPGVYGTLHDRAEAALASNATVLGLPSPLPTNNAFLALGAPTNVQTLAQVQDLTRQIRVVEAQVVSLTRQVNALIRLQLGWLDSEGDS